MKHFLSILFIFSLNLVSPLLAQDKSSVDMSALLENKIWKVQLPQDKQYAIEMEFRSAEWKQSFLYDKKQTPICYSYSLHEDCTLHPQTGCFCPENAKEKGMV